MTRQQILAEFKTLPPEEQHSLLEELQAATRPEFTHDPYPAYRHDAPFSFNDAKVIPLDQVIEQMRHEHSR